MADDYEKDITENLGNDRNLILLGVRADADIQHLKKKLQKQEQTINYLDAKINSAMCCHPNAVQVLLDEAKQRKHLGT